MSSYRVSITPARKWFPYTALDNISEDSINEEEASMMKTEEDTLETANHRQPRRDQRLRRCRECWPFIAAGMLTTILLTVLSINVISRPQKFPERWDVHVGGTRKYQHCGKSAEEAVALGCEWDIMSFSWVHPACFNKAESKEWEARYGPWEWYPALDSDKSEAIPAEDLPYSSLVFTQQGYHVVHCLYIWKLIHLAGMNRHLVTNEGIPFQHTQHCVDMIGNSTWTPFETVNTGVNLLFGECVSLD